MILSRNLIRKKFSRKIFFLGENTHLKAVRGTDSASDYIAVPVQQWRVLVGAHRYIVQQGRADSV